MSGLKPWIRLVRFHEYGPIVVLVCMSSALLADADMDVRLLKLLVYSVVGSVSAFVMNDVADSIEEGVRDCFRNPLVTGELRYGPVLMFFTVTSTSAIASLIGLSVQAFTLGLVTLALAYLYSIGVRFKDRPPADLLVHGLVPALLALTSYTAFSPVGLDALLFSATVFTSSCTVELIQEVRDVSVRGSVGYLGIGRSKDLVLALTVVGVANYAVLTVMKQELRPLASYLPLAYFIIEPVMRFREGTLGAEKVIRILRKRVTAVALLAVTTYTILKFL